MVGFTAGYHVPITSVRLSSGLAGLWQPGHCLDWHLPFGRLPILYLELVRTTSGIENTSRITRLGARHSCLGCGSCY